MCVARERQPVTTGIAFAPYSPPLPTQTFSALSRGFRLLVQRVLVTTDPPPWDLQLRSDPPSYALGATTIPTYLLQPISAAYYLAVDQKGRPTFWGRARYLFATSTMLLRQRSACACTVTTSKARTVSRVDEIFWVQPASCSPQLSTWYTSTHAQDYALSCTDPSC